MFIKLKADYQDETKKYKLLKKIKLIFGYIPEHYQFLADINLSELENFYEEIKKLIKQKNINFDYFTFLRLYIANKKGFDYCINFNTKLLKAKGYHDKEIEEAKNLNFPLIEKENLLAKKTIKAIFKGKNFQEKDLEELYQVGYNDHDIYSSINHGAYLLKNAPIIMAFLKR